MTGTEEFTLARLATLADPYPALAALRRRGPVLRLASGFVAVTGYDAAMEIFRNPTFASGPIGLRYLATLPDGAARDEMSRRINFLDPPDHPRVRGLVAKAFTARRVAGLAPFIAATADRLLDEIGDPAEFDLLARFAHQLPSLVISEMLGVPPEDRDQLTRWSDDVAPLLNLEFSDEIRDRAVSAAEEFHAYLKALLDARAKNPGDDLLSALIAAEHGGAKLTRAELLSLAATLYSAGHRTTRDLFVNGVAALLAERSRFMRLVAGDWSVADVVAEFLRYETPTLFVARIPTTAARAAGVEIEAFSPVVLFLAAANRDPAKFEAPDEFRPGRDGPAPLSFAYGPHTCLGNALARTEAEIMLKALIGRFPRLALAQGATLDWRCSGPFRGLQALAVAPEGAHA